MRPTPTERTSRSARITTPFPHPLQLDRPPDHIITLVSDHLTDIHSTTDKSITAVFPTGAGELHCDIRRELQDIAAVRILHISLPPTDARLSMSIGGGFLSGTVGGGVDYTTTERLTTPPDGDPGASEVVINHSGNTPLSYEFPVIQTSRVPHLVDPITGKLDPVHETPEFRGLLHRTLSASDITPLYLSPSGLNGDHGSPVSSIIIKWLDSHGQVISRTRNVEDFRTIRICMVPKVIVRNPRAAGRLPGSLTGAFMVPHKGGSVLELGVLHGEDDATRVANHPEGLSFTTAGQPPQTATSNGHSLELGLSVAPTTGRVSVASITAPGLAFLVGDTITIRSNATLGHTGNLPGSTDVVLEVRRVSSAHPSARTPIIARVLASTRPSPDIFGHGITTLESPQIATTSAVSGTYIGGQDSRRREGVYRDVIVGQTPFVRFATEDNRSIPDDPRRDLDFPLVFDLRVDGTGNAAVNVTSMGSGYVEGGGTIPKNYIHVDPQFFAAKDDASPPQTTFGWRPKAYANGAKEDVQLATTPAFVHDYKWTTTPAGDLVCASPGLVLVDGVPLNKHGTRVLVQSISDSCTVECIADETGGAISTPSQHNGIYSLLQAGTATDRAILTLSTKDTDAFNDVHFANRMQVIYGDLHGGTIRAPLLTAFHVAGQPLHFRQWTGTADTDIETSVAELEYLKLVGGTWTVLAQPPFTFGTDDHLDVFSSLQAAQNAMSPANAERPLAAMLQLGGSGGNGSIRDTLELATSPYTPLSQPFMHLARLTKAPTTDTHSRTFSHTTRPAAEELYTEDTPPAKQVDGNGPAPPRHVSSSGGILMVDVDIPNKGPFRPTTDRIDVGDTIAVTSAMSHNATLRLSRAAKAFVAEGATSSISPRIHSRGVGHVIEITPRFREEVGIMPWSLTLGLYAM
jgi:hypothetical protein